MRGVRLKGKKYIYTLSYTDDIVLLVKKEGEMRGMLGRWEEYLDRKGLKLNVNKTKMMRCRREGEGQDG